MPLKPIHHVATIASPRRSHALLVDPRLPLTPIQRRHQIPINLTTPIPRNVIRELLPKPRRPPRIRHRQHPALCHPQLRIPTIRPPIEKGPLWPAVHPKNQRIPLGRIKSRRLQDPHLNRHPTHPLHRHRFRNRQIPRRTAFRIRIPQRSHPARDQLHRLQHRRPIHPRLQIHHRSTVRPEHRITRRSHRSQSPRRRSTAQRHRPQLFASLRLRLDHQLPLLRPSNPLHRTVPVARQTADLTRLQIPKHQLPTICLEARPSLSPIRQPATVRRTMRTPIGSSLRGQRRALRTVHRHRH